VDLESTLRREAGRVGIALALEFLGDRAWLTEDETEMILLIGSEALRNVVRHSGSSRCQMTIDVSDCPVFFRIRDWGAGLNTAARADGGLEKLSRLARTLHWTLDVRSLPGLGTELLVVGRGCPRTHGAAGAEAPVRSVVAKESLGSRKRVAASRPIGQSRQQIT
jgi:signal transduction histidine kinase